MQETKTRNLTREGNLPDLKVKQAEQVQQILSCQQRNQASQKEIGSLSQNVVRVEKVVPPNTQLPEMVKNLQPLKGEKERKDQREQYMTLEKLQRGVSQPRKSVELKMIRAQGTVQGRGLNKKRNNLHNDSVGVVRFTPRELFVYI